MGREMEHYVHYKGGMYLLLFTVETHNRNGDIDVVYYSLTHRKSFTRPLQQDSRKEDSWTDYVEWPDGVRRQRFTREAPFGLNELINLNKIWDGL
jgi:hypothetical protein